MLQHRLEPLTHCSLHCWGPPVQWMQQLPEQLQDWRLKTMMMCPPKFPGPPRRNHQTHVHCLKCTWSLKVTACLQNLQCDKVWRACHKTVKRLNAAKA